MHTQTKKTKICENCGTSETLIFRRGGFNGTRLLCNACQQHYRYHGQHRPQNKPYVYRSRRSRKQPSNKQVSMPPIYSMEPPCVSASSSGSSSPEQTADHLLFNYSNPTSLPPLTIAPPEPLLDHQFFAFQLAQQAQHHFGHYCAQEMCDGSVAPFLGEPGSRLTAEFEQQQFPSQQQQQVQSLIHQQVMEEEEKTFEEKIQELIEVIHAIRAAHEEAARAEAEKTTHG